MIVWPRRQGDPTAKGNILPILPRHPGQGKTKALLGEVKRGDPCPEGGHHVDRKIDHQFLGALKQHASLQEGGNPSHMIDVAVGE